MPTLRDEFADDAAMHVGQAEVAAGIAVGEPLVIEAQQVEHRGVQIMDVDAVFHGAEAELVCSSMYASAPNAAAGHPHGEAPVVVVAAVDFSLVRALLGELHGRRAAKLAAPQHQR